MEAHRLKKSRQESRQSEPSDQKFTLEDYIKKPAEFADKLLPNEAEERVITTLQQSHKEVDSDLNPNYDRRKKNVRKDEKLVVEDSKALEASLLKQTKSVLRNLPETKEEGLAVRSRNSIDSDYREEAQITSEEEYQEIQSSRESNDRNYQEFDERKNKPSKDEKVMIEFDDSEDDYQKTIDDIINKKKIEKNIRLANEMKKNIDVTMEPTEVIKTSKLLNIPQENDDEKNDISGNRATMTEKIIEAIIPQNSKETVSLNNIEDEKHIMIIGKESEAETKNPSRYKNNLGFASKDKANLKEDLTLNKDSENVFFTKNDKESDKGVISFKKDSTSSEKSKFNAHEKMLEKSEVLNPLEKDSKLTVKAQGQLKKVNHRETAKIKNETYTQTDAEECIEKLKNYERLLKAQNKELLTLRKQNNSKGIEIQALTAKGIKRKEKLKTLKEEVLVISERYSKLVKECENKDLLIQDLEGKVSFTSKSFDIDKAKNVCSEGEFWKMPEMEENSKEKETTLKDISKSKALWINLADDKKQGDFTDKLRIKISESPRTRKQYDVLKAFPSSKFKAVRRSLEPLTPISLRKFV